ncbi:hypothetical protein CRG98_006154 [Punica granatum]|uniref:Uncharacterized protein n=1 Tax=Punica granatum TaxID=22663 RepID=A0A2I0KZZ6_PUNGR|nr:hypothetical protein CRG98_006154 [Punica granatum]
MVLVVLGCVQGEETTQNPSRVKVAHGLSLEELAESSLIPVGSREGTGDYLRLTRVQERIGLHRPSTPGSRGPVVGFISQIVPLTLYIRGSRHNH